MAISAIFKNMKMGIPGNRAFWGMGVGGVGASMAAYSLGGWLQSPGKSDSIRGHRRDPYNTKNFKDLGFGGRTGNVAAAGLFSSGAGVNPVGGMFGALEQYGAGRARDFLETSKEMRKPIAAGAAVGGGLGLVTGLAASVFSKIPVTKAVPWLTALGAIAGGYNARKVGLQVSEAFNVAKKTSINRRRLSARATTRGTGYRMWSNASRKGRPGHLGADGTLPFAMHKARHRSTV